MQQFEVNTFDKLCNQIQEIQKKKILLCGIEDTLMTIGIFGLLFKELIYMIRNV